MTIHLDSTIVPVHGHEKGGAAYGYTHHLGYHPLLGTRARTGGVLHARLRKGSANTKRGTKRIIEELVARVRRCGGFGPLSLRANAGFFSWALITTPSRLLVTYSIMVNVNAHVQATIDAIHDNAWRSITYRDGGVAEVAETTYVVGGAKTKRAPRTARFVVRRTRICDPVVQTLRPDWRHHAFVTDVALDAVAADAFHRDHARIELAIRDLKEGAGLEHCPSGPFFANAAWLACAVLAHDLVRWSASLGAPGEDGALTVAGTVRTRLFGLPGPLMNRSG